MKVRIGFVSNSSSSSYLIRNLSGEEKTLADFIQDNPQLVDDYNSTYVAFRHFTHAEVIHSAETLYLSFAPGEAKEVDLGTETTDANGYGAPVGRVCYWMGNGHSENWEWDFLY